MLDKINRYAHGFVAVPVICTCSEAGVFELLSQKKSLKFEEIVEYLAANSGHLKVALRLLESLSFLYRSQTGAYILTEQSQQHQIIPKALMSLYKYPFELYLKGEVEAGINSWINLSCRRWDTENSLLSDLLDGVLVIPLLLELKKQNLLDESKKLFNTLTDSVQQELSTLFINLGWAEEKTEGLYLTDIGRFMSDRSLNLGITGSYAPMLSQMKELLFGNPQKVFERDKTKNERHLDRTLNVVASGFQHEKFFADTDEIIISIFNQQPIEEQPSYIVDMGCGDGTLLKRIYKIIKQFSARGKVLTEYPIIMVGADYNQEALEVTGENLAEIPHLLIPGDIGAPEKLLEQLKAQGIEPEKVLHIRSFLDHDRPFIAPQDIEKAETRSHLDYQVVDVDTEGKLIPPHIAVQSLVEHLERWSSIVTRHGLLLLEVHSLTPGIVKKYLDESESLHFDAYHAFSMQHLVEADVFLMAAAEVGLFPKTQFFRKYPRVFPFTRITLNNFEKRTYRIRHPQLEDISALMNLEKLCWEPHLQCSQSLIEQRIKDSPKNHLVLEVDKEVVGVIYTQRIENLESLKSSKFKNLGSLRTPDGEVLQFLSLNIHPQIQGRGWGDQLRKFTLQWAALKGGIEEVAGVTRCRYYHNNPQMSMREYIEKCNNTGEILDPILRFHVGGGASIVDIVPNYRPEDSDNQGSGVLIKYELTEQLEEKKTEVESPSQKVDVEKVKDVPVFIENSIKKILGKKRSSAFSYNRPIREMGLDSLDLLELRSLLEKGLGKKLDSTIFFDYGTAAALGGYFNQQLNLLSKPDKQLVVKTDARSQEFKISRQTISEVEQGVNSNQVLPESGVAIIGMACRFPGGVNSPEDFWQLLSEGKDAIGQVPTTRWDIDHYLELNGEEQNGSRFGGFLDQVDYFDAPLFRMSPREASGTDPQHRILLEESWQALERAGIAPDSLVGTQTGVFVGMISHDYELLMVKQNQPNELGAYFSTGNSSSVAAGRLAYFLGVQGPALCVDTACSSSLVAIHLAAQSLLKGECNLALAAGVNLILSPELSLTYSQAGMLSPDGRCKTFDAAANGYVRSEGCGVINC
ncbi:MAG: GNAT family N-acetyltransferase [Okeania sp. SIO3B5]|uniref:GNAT family N-acetyltransferase n=1 Tax=Okeania sp. SIO3B5 TaxID=2607811 RepID=UPI0013FF17FF|nr:GNAT family N-acetyltransferase [Okeania sp. SIO3B5]NEO55707.1 GNAT family N-acetyltransferase [Okeania sp. SIO3B5]